MSDGLKRAIEAMRCEYGIATTGAEAHNALVDCAAALASRPWIKQYVRQHDGMTFYACLVCSSESADSGHECRDDCPTRQASDALSKLAEVLK